MIQIEQAPSLPHINGKSLCQIALRDVLIAHGLVNSQFHRNQRGQPIKGWGN